MILDVVDAGPFYISMLLFPIVICFIFITIGRYNAYKKNRKNKEKTQFIIFLVMTIILSISMLYLFFYTPLHSRKKPSEPQWHISTYPGD